MTRKNSNLISQFNLTFQYAFCQKLESSDAVSFFLYPIIHFETNFSIGKLQKIDDFFVKPRDFRSLEFSKDLI